MAQMKAYTIPRKNWTQICRNIVFCGHEQVQPASICSHLTALKHSIDDVIGMLPCPSIFGIDEKDEVGKAKEPKQHSYCLNGFPERKARKT